MGAQRPLTNKATAVLMLLREGGEWTTKEVAEAISTRTPCGKCDGTGEGDDSRYGCKTCYGRGRMLFGYSTANTTLRQLMRRRLVARRYVLDEWGDVTPRLVYFAVPVEPDSADPLEQVYEAPAFEKDGGS